VEVICNAIIVLCTTGMAVCTVKMAKIADRADKRARAMEERVGIILPEEKTKKTNKKRRVTSEQN